MDSRSSSKIISSLLLQKTKNQIQNNPTYLTKNPNFWSAILSTKKEDMEDTTTYYYNVFNVGSQLCLFVRLFDSNIQFKISLMISFTSSRIAQYFYYVRNGP